MTDLIRWLILAALLFSPPVLSDEVCRWVDGEGVTHFTKECPEDQEGTLVVVEEGLTAAQLAAAESRSQELHSKVVTRRETEALDEKARAREERQRKREQSFRNYNCAHAGHMIKTLTRPRPVFFDDHGNLQYDRSTYARDYEGGRRYLEAEERAQLIEQWNTVLVENCDKED